MLLANVIPLPVGPVVALFLCALLPFAAWVVGFGVKAWKEWRQGRPRSAWSALAIGVLGAGLPLAGISCAMFSRPLIKTETRQDWRIEHYGDKSRGYEYRVYFQGRRQRAAREFNACRFEPVQAPKAVACTTGTLGVDPGVVVLMNKGGKVESFEIREPDFGVFSADGSAYLTDRSVHDLRTWRRVPLPPSLKELWPPTKGFLSPYFAGPSPEAQSVLWFEAEGEEWRFHLTELETGSELQTFRIPKADLPLTDANRWQDAAEPFFQRFRWERSADGRWRVVLPL